MLLEFTVENIALITRADLHLIGGFTALTGETGAGKSLVVDALSLALGGRADAELVRDGERKGTVTLLADLGDCPTASQACSELGIELEDGQLLIQRDLTAEGRSTVRINGRPSSVGILRQIGTRLVDLHGQHDHQSLLQPEEQIRFLDDWIGAEAETLKHEVAERFETAAALRTQLRRLQQGAVDRRQRADLLRFQIDELASADIQPGEMAETESRMARLRHAERLGQRVSSLLELVGDADGSAVEKSALAARECESLARLDPSLETIGAQFRQAEAILAEAARSLRTYGMALEHDPDALEEVAARLDLFARLRRKYGETEREIFEFIESAGAELDSIEHESDDLAGLAARIEEAEGRLQDAANRLSELRRGRAKEFGIEVQRHIRDLAMDHALFSVAFEAVPISTTGQDTVEFQFSANRGESPRPLHKVASGGELSRVMLAIKVASAGSAGIKTLIFDEVDAGLSGRAAAITAKKLRLLAEHCQVVVISHLPQIAGAARNHFRIEKSEERGRSITRIQRLDGEERTEEIARMLAGEKISGSALANARELIAHQSGALV